MGWLAGILATVVVGLLLFVQPRRGKRRFEQLQRDVLVDPTARVRYYRRSITAAWIMTGVVAAIGLLAKGAGHDLGLPPAGSDEGSGLGWTITIEAFILIPISALVLRSNKPRIQRIVRRQIGHLKALLPVTRDERLTFVGVSLTAGVCEEVVYRWFGITYVRWVAPGSSDLAVIVVIGLAFGFAHYYQGKLGVLMTGIAGAAFTWLTLATGSLIPAIVIHALIDLRIVALREVAEPDAEPPSGERDLSSLPAPPS